MSVHAPGGAAGRTRPPATYRLALPPPWVRVPLRGDPDGVIERIVETVAATTPASVPPDQVGPRKRELARHLQARAAELRARGGIDLYVPVGDVHGFSVRASFVVSEVRPGAAEEATTGQVRSALVAGEGSTGLEETPGPPGSSEPQRWVRRQRRIAPGDADPALVVDWTTDVPGTVGRWLLSSFSVVGSDVDDPDGTAGLLVELFDAIMTTWRWVYDDPAPTAPAPAEETTRE